MLATARENLADRARVYLMGAEPIGYLVWVRGVAVRARYQTLSKRSGEGLCALGVEKITSDLAMTKSDAVGMNPF